MKICGICPTCNRPELLGQAIKCFERQTHDDRFLIILDDLGQYENQHGDRWELISIPRRVLTLGEKNNICAALAPRDTDAYFKVDDDDLLKPWAFEAAAEALTRGEFVQPHHVVDFIDGRWVVVETFSARDPQHFCYHSSWSYSRDLFKRLGGYHAEYAGDDQEFQRRTRAAGIKSIDIDPKYPPFLWYNRKLANRISEAGDTEAAYVNAGLNAPYVGKVPKWTDDSDWNRPTPMERIARPW
jgi:glycosyltransferase involved in cell wall biosynthesis